jgi:hypothetical protein
MKVVSKWHCSATEEPAATLPRHDRRVGAILRTIGKQAKNRETPMNKTVLSIIVCSMFALPAGAATISGGKITSVDAGGTSFSYSKKKKHWKFRITDKTVIRVGDKTGTLSDHFSEIRQPQNQRRPQHSDAAPYYRRQGTKRPPN